MATNVPITDTGIANIIMKVARKLLKKSMRIHTANIPPIMIFCWTKAIAAFMYTVSSYTFFKTRPFSARIPLFNTNISFLRFCIIATTFEFGSLITEKVIAS